MAGRKLSGSFPPMKSIGKADKKTPSHGGRAEIQSYLITDDRNRSISETKKTTKSRTMRLLSMEIPART
nr:MAG TPA: hypothetical protein [Caudoviricetes sp.]